MKVEDQQLKAFLLDADLISEEDFKKAQKKALETKQKIDRILVSEGMISEEKLIRLESYILGIPFINLESEKIPLDVLRIIPEPIARTHNIVAFRKDDKNLEVAMLDPEDLKTIEFIKKSASLKILPRLTTDKSIKFALKQYQKSLEVEFGGIIKKEASGISENAFKGKQGKNKPGEKKFLEKKAVELPIIRIVDVLIKHAILQRASDIHIEPTDKDVVVRYRIDGILHDAMTLPKKISSGVVARIKVLASLKLDEHRLPQDGRFKFESKDYNYSLRVSILPVFNGEKIVMRLLSESSDVFTLEELGLRGKALEDMQDNLRKPIGMILVSGPTGSGKTTSLYAMMEILNSPKVNISTVEDPIEYKMPRINQTQVNSKIGLTFASGLRSLVRQDPDIIMVGEIRDKETAGLAINAALTGHLVLSTLHATSAAGAIPRLIDMDAEPFLISSTLSIILAQRLARKLSSDKEKYKLSSAELKNLAKYCNIAKILKVFKEEKLVKPSAKSLEGVEFYRPKKLGKDEEGYKGRIGIYEVLPITETIKELIVKQVSSSKIQEQAEKEGMVTMVEDGLIKAAQGITSIEEVLRIIAE